MLKRLREARMKAGTIPLETDRILVNAQAAI
jgi:hypothetical protein